jgi:hypothetical protein
MPGKHVRFRSDARDIGAGETILLGSATDSPSTSVFVSRAGSIGTEIPAREGYA